MSEIIDVPMTAQRDIQIVTVEINVLHRQAQEMALSYAIQIGQRLKEAKAMLPHGEWGRWLETEVPFKPSTAQNFMRIFDEYGSNQTSLFGDAKSQTIGNLPYTKALKLLAIGDSDEREAFIEENDVANMSTRELEKAIRERDEARQEADLLKKRSEFQRVQIDKQFETENQLKKQLAELNAVNVSSEELEAERAKVAAAEKAAADANAALQAAKDAEAKAKESAKKARADLKALKENPVIPDDTMEAIRKEAEEAAAKAAQDEVDKQVAEAKKRADDAEKAAKEAAEALEQAKRQAASSDPDTAVFKTYFSAVQEDFNRLHGVFLKIQQSDPGKADKLKTAMTALLQKMGETWK